MPVSLFNNILFNQGLFNQGNLFLIVSDTTVISDSPNAEQVYLFSVSDSTSVTDFVDIEDIEQGVVVSDVTVISENFIVQIVAQNTIGGTITLERGRPCPVFNLETTRIPSVTYGLVTERIPSTVNGLNTSRVPSVVQDFTIKDSGC